MNNGYQKFKYMPHLDQYIKEQIIREIPASSNETLSIWAKVYAYDADIREAIIKEYNIRQIA